MKNLKKLFLIIPVLFFMFTVNVSAAPLLKGDVIDKMNQQTDSAVDQAGYVRETTIFDVISSVITVALSLLSILFLVLIVVSGYNWMMAGGDEKVIETAKARIKNAIIGLAIVLAAYAITAFVFNSIDSSTGGTQNQTPTGATE